MLSRYGPVGLLCATLNVAIVWMATELLGLDYLVASVLACSTTITLSYWMHRRITFELTRASTLDEFVRHVMAQLSQFAIGMVLMTGIVEFLHCAPWLAMAAVSVMMMGYGFLMSSSWVFRIWRKASHATTPADDASPARRGLRVLQVSAFFPAHGGGIEVVAGQLARHLALSGADVTWMAGGPAEECPAPDPGVPIAIDRASSFDPLERRLGLPAPIWSPASLRRLWRHVGACDIVQVHDYLYVPSLAALLFARLRRRPVVLTQHVGEIPYTSAFTRGLLQAINRVVGRLALGAAAQVVFVGRPVQAYFERFVRFRRPSLLIANGVDQAVYRPAEGPPSHESGMRALFVGRFVEKKGLRLLENCMSVPGIRWEFVGRGPLSPEHWNVPADVLAMRGVLEPAAVADAMRGADLLVLPSQGEGFPLVVQEALACGTPVLVSEEVAEAFPIRDPRCVWAVDVSGDGAAARLRAALERLAADPATLRAARPLALALAGQWSWQRCVESYRAVYDGLERAGAHPTEGRLES